MKFLYFAFLALTTMAAGTHGRVQDKLVASYPEPVASSSAFASAAQSPIIYTRTSRPVLEQKNAAAENQQQYVAQPQAYATQQTPQQQYYQAQPQAVAYTQPAVSRLVNAPAVQKIAYVQQQQQQPHRRPQQYSSAADVSSFSYTSPVVAYSNLGVLRPVVQRPQHQQVVQAAATSFNPSPVTIQYAATNNYPSASNAAYDAPSAYQAVAQKAAYAEAQSQSGAYQTAPTNQKYIYQSVPAYQLQATQKLAPQVAFAPSQQFAYQAPQAAASQNYEVAAHSIPQVFYAQPAAQPQYYMAAPQSKYADPDIIYGH